MSSTENTQYNDVHMEITSPERKRFFWQLFRSNIKAIIKLPQPQECPFVSPPLVSVEPPSDPIYRDLKKELFQKKAILSNKRISRDEEKRIYGKTSAETIAEIARLEFEIENTESELAKRESEDQC